MACDHNYELAATFVDSDGYEREYYTREQAIKNLIRQGCAGELYLIAASHNTEDGYEMDMEFRRLATIGLIAIAQMPQQIGHDSVSVTVGGTSIQIDVGQISGNPARVRDDAQGYLRKIADKRLSEDGYEMPEELQRTAMRNL